MLPYPKAAPYFDSFPLLEITAWSEATVLGLEFDVVDFLTAIHSSSPGPTTIYEAVSSDPRYVVTWAMQGNGWTLDFTANHTRAHFILEGDSGGGVFTPAVMHVVPMAEPVAITVGASSVVRRNLNGVLRVNCRRVRASFTMTGDAPTAFRFGAFLRVL